MEDNGIGKVTDNNETIGLVSVDEKTKNILISVSEPKASPVVILLVAIARRLEDIDLEIHALRSLAIDVGAFKNTVRKNWA